MKLNAYQTNLKSYKYLLEDKYVEDDKKSER